LYLEVVIPASGKPVGRGGRYNNLTACFGNPESAIGFTLHVDSILKYAVHDTTKDPENKEEKKVMIPLQEDLIKSLRESMELRKKHPIVILK
jgi:ATP phosphoribosyltransferase regulatory subunit HisZ